MRRILLIVIIMSAAFSAYAQTGKAFNVSDDGSISIQGVEPGIKSSSGIAIGEDQLNAMVQKYLEDIFNKHLTRKNLRITELSNIPDWNLSTAQVVYLNVQARFLNFPINRRILTGRLETKLAVRKETGLRKLPGIDAKDNKDINITLLVDDYLSEELRNAMVIDYLKSEYSNPLDINLNRERVETYPDKIYSYVSSVINNNSIVYLRAIFERRKEIEEKTDIFTIRETPWLLGSAVVVFSEKFPNSNSFRKDIREDMYEPMRGYHIRTYPREGNPNNKLSKIESVTSTNLIEANNGMIKLEMDLIYLMDWYGIGKSSRKYNVLLNVFYKFNFETRLWEYMGIEEIKQENIRNIK